MSESERSNHWNSVAQDIGIEPPAPPPSPETPGGLPETVARARTKTTRTGVSERAATDWASVANDLGVDSAPAAEKRAAGIAETTDPGPYAGQADGPDVTFVARDEPVVPRGETLSSLGSNPPNVTPAELGEDDIDFGDAEATSSEMDTQRGQRRRRRRPRHRSNRKRVAAGTEAATPPAGTPAAGTPAESRTETGLPNRPREPVEQVQEPTKSDTEDVPEKTARAGHRNIPTWEESVGVIVDSNIENRASRSKTSRPGRPRSRGHKH